ncbi:MAG: peptidoglycan-binding protein [Burkholderiaceae bacterium]|nr:peptidoglycan-binding protein [Burkholderiaceae bacterium]
MTQLIDVVRRCAPRARPEYIEAFENGQELFERYGVTTPLRLAHFLAQVMHESGRLTVVREDMRYRTSRMMQIFGVGRHSARVTQAEAKALAGKPESLAERVYGLGNPRKARELGNTRPGDGWKYRGNGLMQTTGRGAHRRLGKSVGLGDMFERDPTRVTYFKYALLPALAEWKEAGCNAMADRNDIRAITKAINGGYNGYKDRVAQFNKLWPLLRDKRKPAESWKAAKVDPATKTLQRNLVKLGYELKVDGRFGPKTAGAVRDFQARNGLVKDGIPGPITLEAIKVRLAAPAYAEAPETAADGVPDGAKPTAVGVGGNVVSQTVNRAAESIQEQVNQLAPYVDVIPIIKTGAAILAVVSTGLIIYGLWRQFGSSLFSRRPPVPQ